MLVRANGFAIHRGAAELVLVELDLREGLPSFAVIGLGGGAARDTRERVRAAVLNSGVAFPRRRVTVNLAPASSRRSGAELDLAIACCVLAVQGLVNPERLARIGLFAEPELGGDLRPCAGVSGATAEADLAGLAGLIVAHADLGDARAAAPIPVVGLRELRDVVVLLARSPQRRSSAPRPAGAGRTVPDGRPSSQDGRSERRGRGSGGMPRRRRAP